jgi:thioredoxin 2
MASTVITCPHCGTRNRIGPSPEGVPRCGKCHEHLPWVVDATPQTFEAETTASVPVLIDFWAPWCGPCRMVTPAVEAAAKDLAGRMKVVKLNVDEAPEIAGRFGVQGIPLLVLLRDGEEVDRQVGAVPPPQLRRWLDQHLAEAGSAQAG